MSHDLIFMSCLVHWINESWLTWTRHDMKIIHVTRINESWLTYERLTSHTSRHTHEWVTSDTRMSPVTHMNVSCHNSYVWHTYIYVCIYVYVHICIHIFTCATPICETYESQTYECIMPNIWMSHVTNMNQPCHTYEWAMSHTHVTQATKRCSACHKFSKVSPTVILHSNFRSDLTFENFPNGAQRQATPHAHENFSTVSSPLNWLYKMILDLTFEKFSKGAQCQATALKTCTSTSGNSKKSARR